MHIDLLPYSYILVSLFGHGSILYLSLVLALPSQACIHW